MSHKTEGRRPRILICNDDGITAPGIRALVEAAMPHGELTIVAPNSPQSGMGHAITIGEPLRVEEEKIFPGIKAWSCSGTPADCVKLASGVLMDGKPDLLLSGINHGSNHSISVVYSGTLSAAMEGAIEGIPSIGFSLLNYSHHADMSTAHKVAAEVIQKALLNPIPTGTLLNVNIPDLPYDQLKGYRFTRQAMGRWVEEFDQRTDPYGRKYFWLTGKYQLDDSGHDTDHAALEEGFVSVCPVQWDLTAHHAIPHLHHWQLSL